MFIKKEKNQVLLRKRVEKDIWQNLYEFPLVEAKKNLSTAELEKHAFWNIFFIKKPAFVLKSVSKIYKQQLTHRTIFARFFEIELLENMALADENAISVNIADFAQYAFPKILHTYLGDKNEYQQNMLF